MGGAPDEGQGQGKGPKENKRAKCGEGQEGGSAVPNATEEETGRAPGEEQGQGPKKRKRAKDGESNEGMAAVLDAKATASRLGTRAITGASASSGDPPHKSNGSSNDRNKGRPKNVDIISPPRFQI